MNDTASREESVIDAIRVIIEEHLNPEPDKIVPDAMLIDDLGADSLDVVELALVAEERWDIEIPDEEIEKLRTVQNCVDLVTRLLAEKTRVP